MQTLNISIEIFFIFEIKLKSYFAEFKMEFKVRNFYWPLLLLFFRFHVLGHMPVSYFYASFIASAEWNSTIFAVIHEKYHVPWWFSIIFDSLLLHKPHTNSINQCGIRDGIQRRRSFTDAVWITQTNRRDNMKVSD